MNHNEASLIHHDYLLGDLQSEKTAEYEAHLASCVECRAILSRVKRLKQTVERHGDGLFDKHPESEELAALAGGSEFVEVGRLATIRAHISVCPTCEFELNTAQEALRGKVPFRQILWGKFEQPSLRWAVAAGLAIVIAASGGVLSGISNNALKKEGQLLTLSLIEAEQTVSLLSGQLEALRTWSGPFTSLLLSTPFRGGDVTRESIRLLDGQPFLPVFIQLEPSSVSRGYDELNAVLTRISDGGVIWEISGPTESFWDRELQALSFSVSTINLDSGEYLFEIFEGGGGDPSFQSEFHLSR